MPEIDIDALSTTVLWCAFALAVLFGAVAQHTRFCTKGAIADVITMGDWTRLRMCVLAIAVAVIGFNTMVGLGWVQAANSLFAGPRLAWLSLILGGSMFGFGMVLASGSAAGTSSGWVVAVAALHYQSWRLDRTV